MALKLMSSGGGSVTLDVPSTASNLAMTVPAVAGTVLTSANTTNFPAGCVVQVVQQTYDTQISTTALNTLIDGPGTATITPKSATNKILVMINYSTLITTSSAVTETHNIILRGTTVIGPTSGWKQSSDYTGTWNNITITHLDSPATTSPVTYKLQFRKANGSGTAYVGTGEAGGNFRITLMEIQA